MLKYIPAEDVLVYFCLQILKSIRMLAGSESVGLTHADINMTNNTVQNWYTDIPCNTVNGTSS